MKVLSNNIYEHLKKEILKKLEKNTTSILINKIYKDYFPLTIETNNKKIICQVIDSQEHQWNNIFWNPDHGFIAAVAINPHGRNNIMISEDGIVWNTEKNNIKYINICLI